jgi:hypothetical protein
VLLAVLLNNRKLPPSTNVSAHVVEQVIKCIVSFPRWYVVPVAFAAAAVACFVLTGPHSDEAVSLFTAACVSLRSVG